MSSPQRTATMSLGSTVREENSHLNNRFWCCDDQTLDLRSVLFLVSSFSFTSVFRSYHLRQRLLPRQPSLKRFRLITKKAQQVCRWICGRRETPTRGLGKIMKTPPAESLWGEFRTPWGDSANHHTTVPHTLWHNDILSFLLHRFPVFSLPGCSRTREMSVFRKPGHIISWMIVTSPYLGFSNWVKVHLHIKLWGRHCFSTVGGLDDRNGIR